MQFDVARGLGICYNGDDFDGSIQGYGFNPPSVAVDFFIGPVPNENDGVDNDKDFEIDEADERIIASNFLYYNNVNTGINGNPSIPIHFFNYLRSRWQNGAHVTYDGEAGLRPGYPKSNYIFPGTSDKYAWSLPEITVRSVDQLNPQPNWTERSAGNAPGDRRFLISAGEFTLKAGSVNAITIGVIWSRTDAGGATGSFNKLLEADDQAQRLFDNDFQLLQGPNAPDLLVTELDEELILTLIPDTFSILPPLPDSLKNDPDAKICYYGGNIKGAEQFICKADTISASAGSGVMTTETYRERDNFTAADYTFQGYKIYQLKRENVSLGELDNPDRARLIAQFDVKDGVTDIINQVEDPITGEKVGRLQVSGADEGISNSIRIVRDVFASGTDGLINYKKYYFVAISYAYNAAERPDPNGNLVPIDEPYIQGRNNVEIAVGIPHKVSPEKTGTILNAEPDTELPVTRITGQGTGDQTIEITEASKEAILDRADGDVVRLEYELGASPVQVKVFDPKRVRQGEFQVEMTSSLNYKEDDGRIDVGDTLISLLPQNPTLSLLDSAVVTSEETSSG